MAKVSIEIIHILRETAREIDKSSNYQWGHMGACNCGFLAQQVTNLTKAEIHSRALQRHGDWNEQLNDYCPTSGLLFDEIISQLLETGFATDDLKHLENLSDPLILRELPGRVLNRNRKADVVLYVNAWASRIEREIVGKIKIKLPDYRVLQEG